jgi:tripartite-type tricarboxylate transporter receptor subunit TctC
MKKLALILLTAFYLHGVAVQATNNPLNLIVGFAAGGTSSTAARILAESVESITGSTVIVENRLGSGGAIAAEWVRQQRGSKTLLFMSSTSTVKVPPSMGLVAIGAVAAYSFVVVARKDAPATLEAYMEAVRQSGRSQSVATAGAGSVAHLIGVRLFEEHGVPMVHVPFQGSSQAILAVLGGHVPLAVIPLPDFVPFREELRIIAESGWGIDVEGWIGIFAPPHTPQSEVARLADIFQRASERGRARLGDFGFRRLWLSGEELSAVHRREYSQWLPLLERLGIQP